jgi:hypothetical protein
MANTSIPLAPAHGPVTADRRASVRYPWLREVQYRFSDECGTALMRDLSADGASFLLPRELAPGMIITIELLDVSRQCWHLKVVEVVRVAPRSPGLWLVGSQFTTQLSDDELQLLLRGGGAGKDQ